MSYNNITQQDNTGSFIPTTILPSSVNPEQLYQHLNRIILALNVKETGYYLTQEFTIGSLFFNPADNNPINLRPEFRTVYNIGGFGAGVKTVPHNLPITSTWTFTEITGTASDTVGNNYYQLPWASAAGATNIELKVNATNIVITNNSGVTFTQCYVILRYLKQ